MMIMMTAVAANSLDVFLKACNNTCVACVTLQPRFGMDSLLLVILNTKGDVKFNLLLSFLGSKHGTS